jgi:hypothetical protein
MRDLGSVALIGLFLSILGASAASADQCPSRDSPIVTDRPDVTNSSLVVPEGSFQSENGINFIQRGGSHEFDGTESRLRWGVVPCLEVLVDLPTYFAAVAGQLHHQPTPDSVQNAERNARLAAAAALDRVRQADVEGNAVACAKALDEAKHHWIIPPLS